jgi:UDP-N-acetylglucosamine 2-epimerase (non-hydrolysing)
VRDIVEGHLKGMKRVHLLEPLNTKETHNLMNKCSVILTDSGGIQEEAPHLAKPVLVLRDVTERPEAIEAGTAELVGTNIENIVKSLEELLHNKVKYNKMSNASNPYGDGNASERILKAILYYFKRQSKRPEDFMC